MGRIYYKELPLFHIYDSDLTGTQKLLMFLLGIDEKLSVYELGYFARMQIDDVMFDLKELKQRGYLQDK